MIYAAICLSLGIFSEEKFWVALGSVVTASALFYTITLNLRNSRKELSNLKNSLFAETVLNLESVFIGGVDRPLIFDAFKKLRNDFIGSVKDEKLLAVWFKLYLELEHYEKFVNKFYLTDNKIDRKFTTERQIKTINVFLEYFNKGKIEYEIDKLHHTDSGNSYIESIRDEAIPIYEKNKNKWRSRIKSDIDKLV